MLAQFMSLATIPIHLDTANELWIIDCKGLAVIIEGQHIHTKLDAWVQCKVL